MVVVYGKLQFSISNRDISSAYLFSLREKQFDMPEISLLPSDSAVTSIAVFWRWGLGFFPRPGDWKLTIPPAHQWQCLAIYSESQEHKEKDVRTG